MEVVGGAAALGVGVVEVVGAHGEGPVVPGVVRIGVEHETRAVGLVRGRVVAQPGELAVAGQLAVEAPVADVPVGGEERLGARGALGDAALFGAVDDRQGQPDQAQLRRVRRDRADVGLVVVHSAGELQRGVFQLQRPGGHQVDAARARVDRVGEEAAAADERNAHRGEVILHGRSDQVAAEDDPVVDVDLVEIQCGVQAAGRGQHQAEAVVARFLRLQCLSPQRLRRRIADREGTDRVRDQVAAAVGDEVDRGAGVVLLLQRRRAETVRHGAAQGQRVGQRETPGQLGRGGAAEIAVMFAAHRQPGRELVGEVALQVHVKRAAFARVRAGVAGLVAGEHLRAGAGVRGRVALLEGELLAAVFQAPGHGQSVRQHGGLEVAAEVGVVDILPVGQGADVEAGGRIRVQRVVVGVAGVQLPVVAAGVGAEVVMPAGHRAAQAEHFAVVADRAVLDRQIAVRIDRRRAGVAAGIGRQRTEEAAGADVALVEQAEGVELRVRGEVVLQVDRRLPGPHQRDAVVEGDLPVAGITRVAHVGTGTIGRVLVAGVRAQVHPALVAEFEAAIGAALPGGAVTLAVLAAGEAERAVLRATLEDDVDHAGDRVRTVLRRGAVAQYLDALDRVDRDRVDVHRRGAAAQ